MEDREYWYADICYECGGYGDDYSYNEDGKLVCNCDTCWVTLTRDAEDDE